MIVSQDARCCTYENIITNSFNFFGYFKSSFKSFQKKKIVVIFNARLIYFLSNKIDFFRALQNIQWNPLEFILVSEDIMTRIC